METRSRLTRKTTYTIGILATFFGLLPALLTPSVTPRVVLTSEDHNAASVHTLAGGTSEADEPGNHLAPWGTTYESRFIQISRVLHKFSALQNVAAVRLQTAGRSARPGIPAQPARDVVVVAASAGTQVDVRNALFDVYFLDAHGRIQSVNTIRHNDYLMEGRTADPFTGYRKDKEDNWDSEQLIAIFIQSAEFVQLTGIIVSDMDPETDYAVVESELDLCRNCAPRIASLLVYLGTHLIIRHNYDLDPNDIASYIKRADKEFKKTQQEIANTKAEELAQAKTADERQAAIDKAEAALKRARLLRKNAPGRARTNAQKMANERKGEHVEEWLKNGALITGQSKSRQPSVTTEREVSKAQQLLSKDFSLPQQECGNGQSLDNYSRNGRPGMELAALTSAANCPEGEGTPGGLAKSLQSADLGGVDFSTLQMRYMSDSPGSGGLQYSLSGKLATSGLHQDITSGLSAVTNSAADLRTWLVLSPDKFWVNLNPTEPNRIVDPKVGQTNAGKAMLDADLQMKRTEAKLEDPHTKLGAQYWKALMGSSSQACYESRMWIVPGDVEVHPDGGSLYILKAQLAVKAVPEHVTSSQSCHYTPETDARGQRLDDTLIVPRVTKAVNTAPEYAPIRRAFMARVVAQWIRDRHASGQRTSFDSLIDSGNIGPAKLTDGWQPRQVFNDYMRQLQGGAFTYTTTVHDGRNTVIHKFIVGGVDFSKLSPTKVSAAQMEKQDPHLPQTAKASTTNLAGAPDGSMWIGDTIATPRLSLWTRVTDPLRAFVSGRVGIAIILLVALGVTAFGIRRSSRRRQKAA